MKPPPTGSVHCPPANVHRICAWCPRLKRAWLEWWAARRGRAITHGICSRCAARVRRELMIIDAQAPSTVYSPPSTVVLSMVSTWMTPPHRRTRFQRFWKMVRWAGTQERKTPAPLVCPLRKTAEKLELQLDLARAETQHWRRVASSDSRVLPLSRSSPSPP